MRSVARIVVALLLATSGLAAGVPAHAAVNKGIGIRLLDAPQARKGDPRAKLFVVDHVKPGTKFTRRFEVANGTAAAVTLKLYASSAEIRQTGWAVLPGRTANELTSWTTVTPNTVQLAPGKSVTATLAVAVPADASTGERYAAVLAEAPPAPGQGVAIASRVGIRMYLDVGPGGEPASEFTISSLTAQRTPEGQPAISATVKNTGGRALDMTGSASLTEGPGGLRAGPFPVEGVRTLAVGTTGEVLVKLDKTLPKGPWKARVDMQSGFIKHSATATITFPDEGSAAPVDAKLVQSEDSSLPWGAIAAGAGGLLALGIIFAFLWKRRSRTEDKRAPAIDVTHH
jgi:hypothetical protein